MAGSMRALAEKWGMSAGYICHLLNRRQAPGPRVLKLIGVERVKTIVYRTTGEGEGTR